MTNQILWLQSVNVPALKFKVNMQGESMGAIWEAGAAGYVDLAADRVAVTDSESAQYFDNTGRLTFSKWLQHEAAREAAANALYELETAGDAAENAAFKFAWEASLAVCLAPALTYDELALKADKVAVLVDPLAGDTKYDTAILKSLAHDAKTLAAIHNSNAKAA